MKPVVFYTPHPMQQIRINEGALIFGLKNHPNPNLKGDVVHTSVVVNVGENGEFETMNTMYRPAPEAK